MGMDVYGKNPSSENGKYFRNNVWWWHPLADYCCEIAPDICAQCTYWHSNDGAGLDEINSKKLAARLEDEIATGRAKAYELRYTSAQEATPNIACNICAGTGTRLPVPHCGAGDPARGGLKCNGCDGTGYIRPHSTCYPFSVENVEEFIVFLQNCGGFEIN